MKSQNKDIARGVLSRFHRDERGTTLTEFVITLPLFIIIFAGVGTLTRMEKESVRTKLMAVRATWDEAMPVYGTKSSIFPGINHAYPSMAAINEFNTVMSNTSPGGDLAALASAFGMINGHLKQAERTTNYWKSEFNGNPSGVPPEGKDFAKKMTSDSPFFDPLPLPEGGVRIPFIVSVGWSMGGSRHAQGAGVRYGTAAGEASRSGSIGRYSYSYNHGYDVMVAPAGVGGGLNEITTIGFSRIPAQKESACLGSYLGVKDQTWKC